MGASETILVVSEIYNSRSVAFVGKGNALKRSSSNVGDADESFELEVETSSFWGIESVSAKQFGVMSMSSAQSSVFTWFTKPDASGLVAQESEQYMTLQLTSTLMHHTVLCRTAFPEP